MKTTRQELSDELMSMVSGGLDVLPDGDDYYGPGTLGFNSSASIKPYKYSSLSKVIAYVNIHDVDKVWKDQDEFDAYMIAGLLDKGLISKI